ncbi:hypothetical protein B0H13DRAFT_1856215 [Mycena leptocephala]|nr:hypothetical protein B0H13DRAFT_1856215 [Mycena leptocephala]
MTYSFRCSGFHVRCCESSDAGVFPSPVISQASGALNIFPFFFRDRPRRLRGGTSRSSDCLKFLIADIVLASPNFRPPRRCDAFAPFTNANGPDVRARLASRGKIEKLFGVGDPGNMRATVWLDDLC